MKPGQNVQEMGCRKIRVLGSGSYGTVFLAEIPSLSPGGNPPVLAAVKSSEIQRSASLQVEGQFLKALKDCDFILQGFGNDVSFENGRQIYNLFLEYAPRGTLENLIRSLAGAGNIPEMEVSRYAFQLLHGILEMHNRGFVHCDLKPANVLVFPCECGCGENHLKIADFGLAKPAGRNIFGETHRGSLMYTSPESLMLGMHEAPKDIWAVGCMVVEMITGRPVWNSIHNEADLKRKIEFDEPEIPEGISPAAKSFLKSCFIKDPNSRLRAAMLLSHPFIATNELNVFHELSSVKNSFGRWISHRDLFSTPSIPGHCPIVPPGFCQPHVVFPKVAKKETYLPRPIARPGFDKHRMIHPCLNVVLGQ